MSGNFQDFGNDFELDPARRSQLEEASNQYFLSLGYVPPLHLIDPGLLSGSSDGEVPIADFRSAGPYELSLVRGTTQTLIDTIGAIEPDELEFDVFFGEAKAAINFYSIRAVIQAEMFVSSIVAEARLVQTEVASMDSEREAASNLIEQRRAARDVEVAKVRANLEQAMRGYDNLGETSSDPLSPTSALRQRYALDETIARDQLSLLRTIDDIDDVNKLVEGLDRSWGGVFDAAYAGYAATLRKRRLRRKVRRLVIRLMWGIAVAFVFLVLDSFVSRSFAFAGSALLAAVGFLIDQRLERLLDKRSTRAKVSALTKALRESEYLLVKLLEREAQVNGVRALLNLQPVRIIRRSTLNVPVF